MSTELSAVDHLLPWERPRTVETTRHPHLVLAWSLDEPERLGEAILIDGPTCVGRGSALADDPAPRAVPMRMRPGITRPCAPIACSRICRLQLLAEPRGPGALEVRSVGRAVMRINGRAATVAEVREDDVIALFRIGGGLRMRLVALQRCRTMADDPSLCTGGFLPPRQVVDRWAPRLLAGIAGSAGCAVLAALLVCGVRIRRRSSALAAFAAL